MPSSPRTLRRTKQRKLYGRNSPRRKLFSKSPNRKRPSYKILSRRGQELAARIESILDNAKKGGRR